MSDPVTRLNSALSGRYRIEREIGEGGMATICWIRLFLRTEVICSTTWAMDISPRRYGDSLPVGGVV